MLFKKLALAAVSILALTTAVHAIPLSFSTETNPINLGLDGLGRPFRNEGILKSVGQNTQTQGVDWAWTSSDASPTGGFYNWARGYFSFDLSSLNPASVHINSAALYVSFTSVTGHGALRLYDVTTDAITLNTTNGVSIYDDLGTGDVYAFQVVGAQSRQGILLNSLAIDDILAAAGGYFSIGSSAALDYGETSIWSQQFATYPVQAASLVLDVTYVPEATISALLGVL